MPSARWFSTLRWRCSGASGSQGSRRVNPVLSDASHCTGVRQPSRPSPLPGARRRDRCPAGRDRSHRAGVPCRSANGLRPASASCWPPELYRTRGVQLAGHPDAQRTGFVGMCMVVGPDKLLKAEPERIAAQAWRRPTRSAASNTCERLCWPRLAGESWRCARSSASTSCRVEFTLN